MRTLVVYFSRKGYVRRAAARLAAQRGADLMELTTPERTRGILGFWWCGRFGMHRWGMPLDPLTADPSAYDHVVVCSPVWVFSVAAPVRTFLQASAGRIQSAEYVLVHFSFPMRCASIVAEMDRLLGLRHTRCTSIVCQWGRFSRERVFEAGTEPLIDHEA